MLLVLYRSGTSAVEDIRVMSREIDSGLRDVQALMSHYRNRVCSQLPLTDLGGCSKPTDRTDVIHVYIDYISIIHSLFTLRIHFIIFSNDAYPRTFRRDIPDDRGH